jgi:HIV Tat-specific factor 1
VLTRTNKKRKEPEDYTSSTIGQPAPLTKRGKGAKAARNGDAPPPERKSKNTAVFVRIPFDATFEEVVERFSKCGLIEEDDEGEPKVKMYAREDGTFSGEALVVYFKEDSVSLAINILDDAELRLGDPSSRMSVQRAEFGHKNESSGGESKPRKVVDRKRITKRIGRMQKYALYSHYYRNSQYRARKLEEWVDEDNFGPAITEEDTQISANKNSRVVVLKHMFTLKELEEDPTLLLDLKEDVREECETLGEVTNVVLYDVGQSFSILPILLSSMSTERGRWSHNGEVQGSHQCTRMRPGTSLSFVPRHVTSCADPRQENARTLFFRTQDRSVVVDRQATIQA